MEALHSRGNACTSRGYLHIARSRGVHTKVDVYIASGIVYKRRNVNMNG